MVCAVAVPERRGVLVPGGHHRASDSERPSPGRRAAPDASQPRQGTRRRREHRLARLCRGDETRPHRRHRRPRHLRALRRQLSGPAPRPRRATPARAPLSSVPAARGRDQPLAQRTDAGRHRTATPRGDCGAVRERPTSTISRTTSRRRVRPRIAPRAPRGSANSAWRSLPTMSSSSPADRRR